MATKPQELEQYITVSITDKKSIIAKKIIGSEEGFRQFASGMNRGDAERAVKQLNKGQQ